MKKAQWTGELPEDDVQPEEMSDPGWKEFVDNKLTAESVYQKDLAQKRMAGFVDWLKQRHGDETVQSVLDSLSPDHPIRVALGNETAFDVPPNVHYKREILAKIQAGEVLTDTELRQVFQDVIQTSDMPAEADALSRRLKEKIAKNMIGPKALTNKDGYIIIGNQAYSNRQPKEELFKIAMDELDHFQENDFWKPTKYPATPNLKKEAYPDVTELVNTKFNAIATETRETWSIYGKAGVYAKFYQKFPNNGDWDMQVGHGLPGQVPIRDGRSEVLLDDSGKVLTQDEYAIFNGKVTRAGYISNYVFGYTAAASGFSKEFTLGAARTAGDLGGKDIDNPKDTQAIMEGWEQYWNEH